MIYEYTFCHVQIHGHLLLDYYFDRTDQHKRNLCAFQAQYVRFSYQRLTFASVFRSGPADDNHAEIHSHMVTSKQI